MNKILNLYILTKIKIFILSFINYKNDGFFNFVIKNIKKLVFTNFSRFTCNIFTETKKWVVY